MAVSEVDSVVDPLIAAYQRSYGNITSQLEAVANDPDQFRRAARLREVRSSIDRELTYLNQEVAPRAVQATYWTKELGFGTGAITAGAREASFDLMDRGAVEGVAKGLYRDLLDATSLVDQTSKRALREIGQGAALEKLIEGQTAVQAGRSMAIQAKDLGIHAVTYSNGARVGLDQYAEMSMRTVTASVYNEGIIEGAKTEGCEFFEIFDGPDCGLEDHNDPMVADGLIVDAQTAGWYPISHPNCRRSMGARPDVKSQKEADEARRFTSEEQRRDQIAADRARGLPVRPSSETAAARQVRGPVQKPSKATQPHRTSKASAAQSRG